jgi:Inosine-uridine nucleoside N-ribohydrolase
MEERKPVWLDCDPGNDDAFAIFLAGHHPTIQLLGISTASGNASAAKTSINACKILHAAGIDDVDVVQGSDDPICGIAMYKKNGRAGEVHGDTGLGTNEFPDPPKKPLKKNAILHMYESIMKSPTKVKLVGTGALTNIALLLKTFPDVKENIDEIVFMGGAVNFGNITPCSEFNIYCDPEAADIVCNSGLKVVMIPLDVTHTTMVSLETRKRIQDMNTKFAKACLELLEFYADAYKRIYSFETCPLHDPCAIAYCISPEIFTTLHCHVDIERHSEKTRGRTICDIYLLSQQTKNVHVALKMDVPKFWELMIGALEKANAKNRVEEIAN